MMRSGSRQRKKNCAISRKQGRTTRSSLRPVPHPHLLPIKEAAKASARAAKKEQTQGGVKLLADEKKREKKERFFAPYVIENVIHASLKVEE